ncbi:MAG: flagellar hook basal-body protein [Planctomycetes bacterium]|nr:flagellar hook basal-body protein [Planctomycetota bacterium]
MTSYSEAILIRGLSFLSDKQAAIANNLANVDTASFKRRISVAKEASHDFQSMLDAHMPAVAYSEQSDFGRGILRETGNRFDIAVDGSFWLRVRNASGQDYYTRNGQLQINQNGEVVTRDGLKLLDNAGNPIQVGAGDSAPSDFVVSPNGTIQDPTTGESWGPIAMVDLPEPESLQPVGRGLYADPKQQEGKQAGDGVRQGFLEGSNVDSLQELVAMITVERSFSATQKALNAASRLQENIITNVLR